MKKIRLWIADDHVVVRNGLRQIAAATPDLRILGESRDGREARAAAARTDIDVLLLDICMPGGGVELIPLLLEIRPSLPILALSMHAEPQIAARAVRAGAAGYVTKDADVAMLLDAVRTLAAGGKFMEPRLSDALLFKPVATDSPSPVLLTIREREILRRLASGEKLGGIAASLGCSPKTVSVHKSRLMRKLGIGSNAELFQYAMRHDLGGT
jgi:DNA-binding NarL/FixJ family response regulator